MTYFVCNKTMMVPPALSYCSISYAFSYIFPSYAFSYNLLIGRIQFLAWTIQKVYIQTPFAFSYYSIWYAFSYIFILYVFSYVNKPYAVSDVNDLKGISIQTPSAFSISYAFSYIFISYAFSYMLIGRMQFMVWMIQ